MNLYDQQVELTKQKYHNLSYQGEFRIIFKTEIYAIYYMIT